MLDGEKYHGEKKHRRGLGGVFNGMVRKSLPDFDSMAFEQAWS